MGRSGNITLQLSLIKSHACFLEQCSTFAKNPLSQMRSHISTMERCCVGDLFSLRQTQRIQRSATSFLSLECTTQLTLGILDLNEDYQAQKRHSLQQGLFERDLTLHDLLYPSCYY